MDIYPTRTYNVVQHLQTIRSDLKGFLKRSRGGDGPMGPFGVISKHVESKVIKKGHHSEMKAVA